MAARRIERLLAKALSMFGYDPKEAELREQLTIAAAGEEGRVPDDQIGYVREFIEHGEYLLALEQIDAALYELEIIPSTSTRVSMLAAAKLMGTDPTNLASLR